jgi:hypothetical protein
MRDLANDFKKEPVCWGEPGIGSAKGASGCCLWVWRCGFIFMDAHARGDVVFIAPGVVPMVIATTLANRQVWAKA